MIKQFTTLLRQLSQFLMNCRSKQQLFHISAVSYCLLFDGLIFCQNDVYVCVCVGRVCTRRLFSKFNWQHVQLNLALQIKRQCSKHRVDNVCGKVYLDIKSLKCKYEKKKINIQVNKIRISRAPEPTLYSSSLQ